MEIFSQQRELLLNNNFSRQRKLSNFEEDEFPKKQSNLCFSYGLLPTGTSKIGDVKYIHSETNFRSHFLISNHSNPLSVINISLLKAYKIIQKWAYA